MKSFLTTCLLFIGLWANAQVFTAMPPLNRAEAKLLEAGILAYRSANPDSVNYAIYSNLYQIGYFIEHPDTLSNVPDSLQTQVFSNIPMKVVDYIEKQQYNGDILKWKESSANGYSNDMAVMQLIRARQDLERAQKEIEKYSELVKNKRNFRCKYLTMLEIPCTN